MAQLMTCPVKYYTHVGANQSMVILHVMGKVQHTLANQCLVMFEVLGNSKSRSTTATYLEVMPGHDMVNILLLLMQQLTCSYYAHVLEVLA